MNTLMNWFDQCTFAQFAFAFILVAVVAEAYVMILMQTLSNRIANSYRKYRLERMDEFEYMNDLY